MINKYIELHDQLMNEFADYHNKHVYFIDKPGYNRLAELTKSVFDIAKTIKAIKTENKAVRKRIQQKHRERLAVIAELKKGKQNDNSNN